MWIARSNEAPSNPPRGCNRSCGPMAWTGARIKPQASSKVRSPPKAAVGLYLRHAIPAAPDSSPSSPSWTWIENARVVGFRQVRIQYARTSPRKRPARGHVILYCSTVLRRHACARVRAQRPRLPPRPHCCAVLGRKSCQPRHRQPPDAGWRAPTTCGTLLRRLRSANTLSDGGPKRHLPDDRVKSPPTL
jgi:hypothetical protein